MPKCQSQLEGALLRSSRSRLIKRKALSGNTSGSASASERIRSPPDFLSRARGDVDKVGKVKALARRVGEWIASSRGGHHGRGQVQFAVLGGWCRRPLDPSPVRLHCWRRRGCKVQQKICSLLTRLCTIRLLPQRSGLHWWRARWRRSNVGGERVRRQQVVILLFRGGEIRMSA